MLMKVFQVSIRQTDLHKTRTFARRYVKHVDGADANAHNLVCYLRHVLDPDVFTAWARQIDISHIPREMQFLKTFQ